MEELEHFIPRNHILKELGGDDDWTYEYIEPQSDENPHMSDDATKKHLLEERERTVKDFEQATLAWISTPQAAENRKVLQERRDSLATSLRMGYWQLDPYIRARTIYDRTGVIREGGQLEFYGGKADSVKSQTGATAMNGTIYPETHADDVD